MKMDIAFMHYERCQQTSKCTQNRNKQSISELHYKLNVPSDCIELFKNSFHVHKWPSKCFLQKENYWYFLAYLVPQNKGHSKGSKRFYSERGIVFSSLKKRMNASSNHWLNSNIPINVIKPLIPSDMQWGLHVLLVFSVRETPS